MPKSRQYRVWRTVKAAQLRATAIKLVATITKWQQASFLWILTFDATVSSVVTCGFKMVETSFDLMKSSFGHSVGIVRKKLKYVIRSPCPTLYYYLAV